MLFYRLLRFKKIIALKKLTYQEIVYKKKFKKIKPIFFREYRPFFWLSNRWFDSLNLKKLHFNIKAQLRYHKIIKFFYTAHARLQLELSKTSIEDSTLLSQLNNFFLPQKLNKIYFFLAIYRSIFFKLAIENFFFFKTLQKNFLPVLFKLFFKFKTNKLFVVMQNQYSQNLIFLSLGFFLKYFEKKKALKKTKNFKLLLSKSLRKIFILARMFKLYLFVRGIPIYLVDMLRTLNKRLDHAFFNPFSNALYDESGVQSVLPVIKIPYFFFLKTKSFTPVKTRKQGRIKRKLRRKIVARNKVID